MDTLHKGDYGGDDDDDDNNNNNNNNNNNVLPLTCSTVLSLLQTAQPDTKRKRRIWLSLI
jgi:hypothetical protein